MQRLIQRFLDLVLSVYLYNEWRGYEQMERDLIPQLNASPDIDPAFIDAVKRHCADEKKHYQMFKGYFIARGRMPFAVGKSIGYFDVLSRFLVGRKSTMPLNEVNFAKLCRAIVTTEFRGIHQVRTMLKWRSLRADERLYRIFQVIERDEPFHFLPYVEWLRCKGYRGPSLWENMMDWCIHYSIAAIVIPFHYLNFNLKRMEAFAA